MILLKLWNFKCNAANAKASDKNDTQTFAAAVKIYESNMHQFGIEYHWISTQLPSTYLWKWPWLFGRLFHEDFHKFLKVKSTPFWSSFEIQNMAKASVWGSFACSTFSQSVSAEGQLVWGGIIDLRFAYFQTWIIYLFSPIAIFSEKNPNFL